MATSTALAQEKIWFDKAIYDKAERIYFEKKAMDKKMVMSRKIEEDSALKSDDFVTAKCQDVINTNSLKSKAEKSKDNKLAFENESNVSNAKRYKCQAKAKINKEAVDVCNVECNKEKNITKASEKSDSAKDNAKERMNASPVRNEKSKKYNAKEAKEKKNKEDTRNKSRENEGSDIERNKEIAMPFVRNKEQLFEQGTQQSTSPILPAVGSLANEVAKARQHIKESLQCVDDIAKIANIANKDVEITSRVSQLEKENQNLKNMLHDMITRFNPWMKYIENLESLESRVQDLEERLCPGKFEPSENERFEIDDDDDKDDNIDLFCSDSEEENEQIVKIRQERLAAYAEKKSKKPAVIAKSNIILDVKPWDDETDMKQMESEVRTIATDGLLWGASKLVPLAYGIHKLQISCVVEDDKVSIDWLTENIQELEDYVQSVDIAAFNKV